jgi:hypothetical protein
MDPRSACALLYENSFQKQFSPTFRNIVFCEDKASKEKKNDILENKNPFLKSLPVFVLVCRKL